MHLEGHRRRLRFDARFLYTFRPNSSHVLNDVVPALSLRAKRVLCSENGAAADRWNCWAYLVFRDVAPVGS